MYNWMNVLTPIKNTNSIKGAIKSFSISWNLWLRQDLASDRFKGLMKHTIAQGAPRQMTGTTKANMRTSFTCLALCKNLIELFGLVWQTYWPVWHCMVICLTCLALFGYLFSLFDLVRPHDNNKITHTARNTPRLSVLLLVWTCMSCEAIN